MYIYVFVCHVEKRPRKELHTCVYLQVQICIAHIYTCTYMYSYVISKRDPGKSQTGTLCLKKRHDKNPKKSVMCLKETQARDN